MRNFSILAYLLISFLFIMCKSPKEEKTAKTTSSIPGARTCFWSRGPVSSDPYINIAYPDAGVFYWSAVFTIPKGAKLELEGEFPHSRYMSFISYNGRGIPQESMADYLIDARQGSKNPFLNGADRTSVRRSYKIEIKNQPAPSLQSEGIKLLKPILENQINLKTRIQNTLHAPAYGKGQQSVVYRIYVPDKGTDETGDVGLPSPILTMPDGKVYIGAEACQLLKTRQPLQIKPDAVGITMEKYYEITSVKNRPFAHPATNPPTWYMQYDRKFLIGMYTGEMPEKVRKSTGGFYPNVDNNYIRTFINRKFGKVFILRGKIPKTPKTWNGNKEMTEAELVYWSLCSVQGFAITRVNDCLFDEQIPINENGEFFIVVSREEDRPRNARLKCGFGWLPLSNDGDGINDEDIGVLQIRNLLAAPDFKHAIQNIKQIGTEEEIMGDYFPRSFYTSKEAFEAFFPCYPEIK
jgi:hypothetical protein